MKKKYSQILFLMLVTLITGQTKISLDGIWKFSQDSTQMLNLTNIDAHKEWIEVEIPGSWHLYSNELLDYQGIGWYKKTILLNSIDESKRYIIQFDAVDYLSELYVNKKITGKHEGGYTPFWYDITEFLIEGENEILLRVNDPEPTEEGTEGISYWNIPHGKQSWYVQNSGIWQSVSLQIKEKIFIENLQITTNINGEFSIGINLNFEQNPYDQLTVNITSPNNEIVYEQSIPINSKKDLNINGRIENAQLWDLENPNLYKLTAKLGDDTFEDKFGFREFSKSEGKFYLNGKPFYMISALDQNFYPETIYKSPSKEYIKDELLKAKELGINTMRCHIKIPEKEYLQIADELGMLVWYEIPNWDVFDESVKARSRYTFDNMLKRDWNHPSLVVLSIINESWGIDLSKPDQRKWLLNEFNYAKEKAIGRLIVDNSACWGNFHLKTDINDYHIYWAIPENYKKFAEQIDEINKRPNWLFSKHGDSHETGNEVLMISEFGNWGLPKLPKILPFWFQREFYDDWITLPAGVESRFNDFKYNRIFSNYDELAFESQIAQTIALKYEIEQIRLAESIQGYCVTEFTDINWEVNGLLDMWRNFKHNKDVLTMIQQPDIIIPRSDKHNFYINEEINIDIFFSYYSGKTLSNLLLKWEAENFIKGEIEILENFFTTDVKKLANVKFSIEELEKPQKVKVKFELVSQGKVIAKNFVDVFVFPKNQVSRNKKQIFVTNKIDSLVLSKVKEGLTVFCIADSSNSIPEFFPMKIVSREGDWLDGNWASALNWYNPNHPTFQGLNFGKSFGFESYEVLPNYVIGNIDPEDFGSVVSGLFIGWVHLNSGYILEMKYGSGGIFLTTLDLSNQNDPYSKALYNNIIDYLNSSDFQPNLEINLETGI